MSHRFLIALLAMLGGCASAPPRDTSGAPHSSSADLVLRGGLVLTSDPRRPVAEAVAIRDGWIVGVGDARAVEPFVGPSTEVIDLAGRAVVPGFVDAHTHVGMESYPAHRLWEWDLSREELLAKLRAESTVEPALPLVLGGWVPAHWRGTQQDLDAISATRPVLVTAGDGHAVWMNGAAMRWLGVDEPGPGAPTASADRREGSVFWGFGWSRWIHARATDLAPSEALEAGLRGELGRAPAQGITSIHNMSFSLRVARLLAVLAERDSLPVRVRELPYGHDATMVEALRAMSTPRPEWFRMSAVKYFLDGAPMTGSARYLEPSGAPDPRAGPVRIGLDELSRAVAEHTRRREQVAFHASGQLAVREALDAIEPLGSAAVALRHRIEHADVIDPADQERVLRLGVIVSMQPAHIPGALGSPSDPSLFPPIARFGLALRVRAGVPVCLGSDSPVPPLESIAQAMRGAVPSEAMTFEEALTAHTRIGAFAAHDEGELGVLAEGRRGDLVILSADPRGRSAEQVAALTILRTLVAGRTTYAAGP